MARKTTVVREAPAGVVFQQSLQELCELEARTRRHGTARWRSRLREYPDHRRHIMEAADGLKAVQDLLAGFLLPPDVANAEIHWTAVKVGSQGKGKTQTFPRNVWRENTCNLWWSVIAALTDHWEAQMGFPGEEAASKLLDDLTAAVELLSRIRFPNRFDRLV